MPRATGVASRILGKVKSGDNQRSLGESNNIGDDSGNTVPQEIMETKLRIAALANEICRLTQSPEVSAEARQIAKDFQFNIQFALSSKDTTAGLTIQNIGTEKFVDRKDKQENPLEFLLRVYKPYFGKGLIRADVKRCDGVLYRSLYTWKARGGKFPDNFDELLPGRRQITDAKLAEAGMISGDLKPEVRDAIRLYQVVRMRRERQRKPV
jgi:hypothetical protein